MWTVSDIKADLLLKLENRSAVIGVVGMGYVGLPFAVEQAKAGFDVIGIDLNDERAHQINQGINYIPDVQDEELKKLTRTKKLRAVSNYACGTELDVIVLAVPTPLTKNLTPELGFIESVTREIAKFLRRGQLVCLESTTYPGTTEEIMLPILESSGLKVDHDFFLAHSPERVDPGNAQFKTKNTAKIVGGVGVHSHDVAVGFYEKTVQVIPVSSAKTAEMVKIFENTFRAVNIALVNELTLLCDGMNLNVWEVLDAAFTKPFGIMPFYPGPGVGGHCIPLDPHYLEWKAKEYAFETHFISLAGEINRKMPSFVREKAHRCLNAQGLAPSKSKVLVLGVAYKKDVGDCRESPALKIISLLQSDGVHIRFYDPYALEIREHDLSLDGEKELTAELLESQDLIVIATHHSSVDYEWVVSKAKAVLDTRNATKSVKENRERIVLL